MYFKLGKTEKKPCQNLLIPGPRRKKPPLYSSLFLIPLLFKLKRKILPKQHIQVPASQPKSKK
jgi:hypothetical protein